MMYQADSVEQARLLTDAHDARERDTMNVPSVMLEVHANALDQERRDRQLQNEQLRIAREQRRSVIGMAMLAVRNRVGRLLIIVGESLRQEPASSSGCIDIPTTA